MGFYGARWYDDVVQRILSADTIVPAAGNPQELNRYSYAGNTPTRYIDPTGHAQCDTQGGGGAYYVPCMNDFYYGAIGVAAAYALAVGAHAVNDYVYHSQSSSSSQSAASSQGGKFGSFDPNDPSHRQMFDEILGEHNQGDSNVSQKTLERMLSDIRAKTGVDKDRFTGLQGGGGDFPDLNTDITSFQKGADTNARFSTNLWETLVNKSSQVNGGSLYVQLNTGLQYDVQAVLNEIMAPESWGNGVVPYQGVY